MKKAGLYILIFALTIVQATAQQTWKADVSASKIGWNARKVTGEHNGTVSLKEGWLITDRGNITSGEFVVDMNTVANTDLKDAESRTRLENHIKSDDFFGVQHYPASKLVITGGTGFVRGTATVKGDLTIKDKTNPVEFIVTEALSGDTAIYTADIVVDRTLYDIKYRSGKFFSDLGDKVIFDEFTLGVKLVVRK
jgi:polyisoprenoid-binding protein YceI